MTKLQTTPTRSAVRPDYVPAEHYTSPEWSRLEEERLWPRVWQIACREEEIPRVGDYVEYAILDESVIIVRATKTEIRAFYNVCQHRGRRLLDKPKGHISQFYCRFHGWKYSLDGKATEIYCREDWDACPSFSDSDVRLKSPKIDKWAGWVWINFDAHAQPLREYLGIVPQMLDPYELENTRVLWRTTVHGTADWKIMVEAFNEGYHSYATHLYAGVNYKPARFYSRAEGMHSTFGASYTELPLLKNAMGNWERATSVRDAMSRVPISLADYLKAMVLEPGRKAAERLMTAVPEDAPVEEVAAAQWRLHQEAFAEAGLRWPTRLTPEVVQAAGIDWHIFPNTVCLPTVDGAIWYRARPLKGATRAAVFDAYCLGRVPPGQDVETLHQTFASFADAVGANGFLDEDFSNIEAVHKGTLSRGFAGGARTNPLQEIPVTNFHKYLVEYLYGGA